MRLLCTISILAVLVAVWCASTKSTPEPSEEEMEEALETLRSVGSVIWQPSSEWILFVRDDDPAGTSWRIYKIRPDGTGLSAVSPPKISNPVWAPDGTMFACAEDTPDDGGGLWVMDLNGNRLRSLGYHPGFIGFAGWSPDGSKIAFTTRRGDGGPYVALMTSQGEEIRFLAEGWAAAWHPSGRYILYEWSDRDGNSHLYEVDVETGVSRQITSGANSDYAGEYSPDGEWIVFLSTRGIHVEGGSRICLVRRDGSNLRVLPLGDNDATWEYTPPSFSPDGQYLVFGKGRWVPTDLYICRIDGTGLRKITSFHPDNRAKADGASKVAKASDKRTPEKPKPAPARKKQPARPAGKKEEKRSSGVPLPWIAPPIR